jgi:hypothetical protein
VKFGALRIWYNALETSNGMADERLEQAKNEREHRSNIILSPYHNDNSFHCEVNIANSPSILQKPIVSGIARNIEQALKFERNFYMRSTSTIPGWLETVSAELSARLHPERDHLPAPNIPRCL